MAGGGAMKPVVAGIPIPSVGSPPRLTFAMEREGGSQVLGRV